MMSLHRGRAGAITLGIAGVVAIGLGCFVAFRGSASADSVGATVDTIAVDAVSGGSVDSSTTVTSPTASFSFDVDVTVGSDPYQAFQGRVLYDPTILGFVSGPVENTLGSAALCGGGTVDTVGGTLYDGCARVSGTQTTTGVAFTWTMNCVASGTTTLHLQTDAEIGVALGTNFGGVVSASGGEASATTKDATVTCAGYGPAPTATNTVAPTATNTPAPPTATDTPCAPNCPTNTPTATATNTSVPPTATNTAMATNTATATSTSSSSIVNTATPTPGTPTPPATSTPAPGQPTSSVPTSPSGGQGGAGGVPTQPGGGQGGATGLPNTGNGGGGGTVWFGTWIIVAGIIATAAGGWLYLRQRKA